jgi:protein-tyrosine phosphatase
MASPISGEGPTPPIPKAQPTVNTNETTGQPATVADNTTTESKPWPATGGVPRPAGTSFDAKPELVVHGIVADKIGNGWPDAAHDVVNVLGGFYGYTERVPVLGLLLKAYPVKHKAPEQVPDTKVQLSRGPRLSEKDMENLKKQRFKAIFNLRAEDDSDAKNNANHHLGLNVYHLKVTDNTPPSREQVLEFLKDLHDAKNQPAYVHCSAGKGRTGVFVACAEIVDGDGTPASVEKALEEAVRHGCTEDSQLAFVKKFGEDFINGRIKEFPPPSMRPRPPIHLAPLRSVEGISTLVPLAAVRSLTASIGNTVDGFSSPNWTSVDMSQLPENVREGAPEYKAFQYTGPLPEGATGPIYARTEDEGANGANAGLFDAKGTLLAQLDTSNHEGWGLMYQREEPIVVKMGS